jgi:hypothetical protein
MKKSSHPSGRSRQQRSSRAARGTTGSWAFNLASESLFALGSSEAVRRVAYRTADGRIRFLPLTAR